MPANFGAKQRTTRSTSSHVVTSSHDVKRVSLCDPVNDIFTATEERKVRRKYQDRCSSSFAGEKADSTLRDLLRPEASDTSRGMPLVARASSLDSRILDGETRIRVLPFHSLAPQLSDNRGSALVGKIDFKFSWQLGNRQVQCGSCKKWWKQDTKKLSPFNKKFACSDKGGFCGTECLICREKLDVEGLFSFKGVDDVLVKASHLSRHFQSSRKCVPDPRALAFVVKDLEDSIPWRAVAKPRTVLMRMFPQACATVTTYFGVATALLWLVQSLQVVHDVAVLAALVERLRVAEGGIESTNPRRARTRSSAEDSSSAKAGQAMLGDKVGVAGCCETATNAAEMRSTGADSKRATAMTKAQQRKQRECEAAGLAVAILLYVDQHLLDWAEMEILSRCWERSATGWVESKVPEQLIGTDFQYIKSSEMMITLGRGSCSEQQQVAAKMEIAREHCETQVDCPICKGAGRNPRNLEDDCERCFGLGVKSGDSKFKQKLAEGSPFKLLVQVVDDDKDLGVFADEDIAENESVCEYVGQIIDIQEARARDSAYIKQGLFYMLEPRKLTSTMKRWVIDATHKVAEFVALAHPLFDVFSFQFRFGDSAFSHMRAEQGNVSRFINHACEPGGNLIVRQFAASGSLSWQDKVS